MIPLSSLPEPFPPHLHGATTSTAPKYPKLLSRWLVIIWDNGNGSGRVKDHVKTSSSCCKGAFTRRIACSDKSYGPLLTDRRPQVAVEAPQRVGRPGS